MKVISLIGEDGGSRGTCYLFPQQPQDPEIVVIDGQPYRRVGLDLYQAVTNYATVTTVQRMA